RRSEDVGEDQSRPSGPAAEATDPTDGRPRDTGPRVREEGHSPTMSIKATLVSVIDRSTVHCKSGWHALSRPTYGVAEDLYWSLDEHCVITLDGHRVTRLDLRRGDLLELDRDPASVVEAWRNQQPPTPSPR